MIKLTEIDCNKSPLILQALSEWAKSFDYFSILNSNSYKDKYGQYELIAAVGGQRVFSHDSFDKLQNFYAEKPSWLFGHFSYDLKNELEDLKSTHEKKFEFAEMTFFEPLYLFTQKRESARVEVFINSKGDESEISKFIKNIGTVEKIEDTPVFPQLKSKQSKQEYVNAIKRLKEEIQFGNIYEINYCQEYYAENLQIDVSAYYLALNQKSPMPFSAFYRNNDNYLICASPERYLCKRGDKIYSQPIKGTARRESNEILDAQIKLQLRNDLKEQTENVMIVDLVRNDLSKTAKKASVKVEELFGIYTFPQVHQLISTVSSNLSSDYHFIDTIKNSFPMGSMTGAPKISAMKLADEHEKSRRELYSGSIGYISPEGNFDFNVIIRSLLYSSSKQYLSLSVGGAITNMSEPESEYEECLLKAKAIFDLQKS